MANIALAACSLWWIIYILMAALQCRPLQAFWNKSIHGACLNSINFTLGIQAVNIMLDVAILGLPMRLVWRLHRPWSERLATAAVFLLGVFVVFASIYRFVAISYSRGKDMTYNVYRRAIWSFVEMCIGLTCSCLPTIRGLFPAYRVGNVVSNSEKMSDPESCQQSLSVSHE